MKKNTILLWLLKILCAAAAILCLLDLLVYGISLFSLLGVLIGAMGTLLIQVREEAVKKESNIKPI